MSDDDNRKFWIIAGAKFAKIAKTTGKHDDLRACYEYMLSISKKPFPAEAWEWMQQGYEQYNRGVIRLIEPNEN